MIKIGVDGRVLTTEKPAGVANFLIAALNNLPKYLPHVYFIIFSHKPVSSEVKKRLNLYNNVVFINEQSDFFSKVGVVWFQLKLPVIIKKYNLNYFWGAGQVIPFFISRKIKKIVTIYDVVFLKYKKTMSLPTLLESLIWMRRSINKSDILWAISDYTRNELEAAFPKKKCKDIFVGLSIELDRFKEIRFSKKERKELLDKYNIYPPFILFVGTLEPRKNLQFLFSLMPDLAMKGISLLVIGAKGWKQNKIISNIIYRLNFPRDKVVFAGYIPFNDLIKLYNTANLLVSTSLNEGYGLPIKEAMACGCPIICPNNSAMSEIVSDPRMKINGWDKDKWVNAIEHQVFSTSHFKNIISELNEWEKISLGIKERLCE